MNENEGSSEYFCKPYVKFYIQGEPVDPDQVTKILGILPSRKINKGDSDGKKGRTWSKGFWGISSNEIVQSDDLESHLEWVLGQLEPIKETLCQIITQDGVEAVLRVVFNIWSHDWDEQISPNMMRRITELKVMFGISFYYLGDLNEYLYGENP